MLKSQFIDIIMEELRTELGRQNKFMEKLKELNQQVEAKGFQPLYSVQQVILTMDQSTKRIRKAMAELPLEDEED